MAQPEKPAQQDREQELARLVLHFAVGLLGTLPLVGDAVARWLGWHIFYLADGRLQLAFATVVLVGAGWPLFPVVYRRPGQAAVLLLLGGAALFGYSGYLALGGVPGSALHFDWAAGLILLALVLRLRATR